MTVKRTLDTILASPGWKTMFSSALSILAGIFSGAFVTEITVAGSLKWGLFYKTISFYVLVLLTIVTYFYQRLAYLREIEISKFSDTDFCVAYMRSKCLPEAAERYKELIRDGHCGKLLEIMKEVKNSLK